MEKYLKIGLIVKPQGIKGEVKVEPLTDDVKRFKNLKEVFIDKKTLKVLSVKIAPDSVFLSLDGIYDRNIAEEYRGKYIYIGRENAVSLRPNSFFIADLIGASVFSDDEEIGKITEITSLKTDVVTVLTKNGKIMRFPFLKDLLIDVNIENGIVKLCKQRLSEVSVYED